jgi:conjugative relaxase-like TrwC/TraI family protein
MILRIHTSTSVQQAENYFIKAASKEAYYSEGQEFTGYWGGQAAKLLGLSGRVEEVAFTRLCNNQHPTNGERLTPRMKSDRRPGYDFNFNCPKSVSLAYAWTKDERILRAFRQAIKDTMEEMEKLAATRVRDGGIQDGDRLTGNWVYGEFIHFTARPENGIPDPHLHAHCYVLNTTFDKVKNRWQAVQTGHIWDEADYFNGAVMMRLRENLQALGLDIVLTEHGFEIAGITRDFIEGFSQRTKTIEEYAAKHGITDPEEKAKLAALTRENKSKSLLIPDLEPLWWAGLTPEREQALNAIKTALERSRASEMSRQMVAGAEAAATSEARTEELAGSSEQLGTKKELRTAQATNGRRVSLNKATAPVESAPRVVEVTEHDRRAVALAMEHLFERHSAVTEMQLMGEALKSWCVGKATLAGIEQAVAEAPLLRQEGNGRKFVTTREVWDEEQRLIDRCINGKFRCEAMNPAWRIEDERLNEQQRKAVTHVLESTDWITGICGRAGVGKTTLLNEVRRGIQSGMHKLIALAPTSEAARDVLRKEGFEKAETVAQLLTSESLQREAQGAVLLVDEAGLLSTREADRLLELSAKLGARLVLIGDIGQHHPVERGQAFKLLQNDGHMAVAEVTEIQRQKGAYKRFVEQFREGDMTEAFTSLEKMDAIFEMTLSERRIALAKDYIGVIERGKTALVVAPTHAECNDVTEGIREALKEKQRLKGGTEWQTLRNLSWTDAERSDADHYKGKRGLVAQINGHVQGFAVGEQAEVIGVRDGMVRVRCKDGLNSGIKALPLGEPEKFGIYERDTIEVCEGDRIRVTGNGRTADRHRLNNGNIHTVDYISHDGKIVLENGWRLDRDFKHLDYGYALTSHAAQGKTVDWVFVAQTAELSSYASDMNQFHVATTRGREGLKLYTTSIDVLKENVSRVRERPMATEIMAGERERETAETRDMERTSDLLGGREAATGIEEAPRTGTKREQERAAEKLGTRPVVEWEMTVEPEPLATLKEVAPVPPAREKVQELEMEMEV